MRDSYRIPHDFYDDEEERPEPRRPTPGATTLVQKRYATLQPNPTPSKLSLAEAWANGDAHRAAVQRKAAATVPDPLDMFAVQRKAAIDPMDAPKEESIREERATIEDDSDSAAAPPAANDAPAPEHDAAAAHAADGITTDMDAPKEASIREERATIEDQHGKTNGAAGPLPPAKAAHAARKNRRWATRLRLTPAAFATSAGITTPAFAQAVATFQAAHGLTIDGIAGPKTAAAVRSQSGNAHGASKSAHSSASAPAAPHRASLLQMKSTGAPTPDADVPSIAAAGVTGGGQPLPHLDRIQAAFGPHDVTGIRAHIGGHAANAATAIGAEAYATGTDVAFRSNPDLHTAAHEAAHVVQQRAGVHLKGGVGEAGDTYEQHADAVADKVVRGESAAALLADANGSSPSVTGVQRRESEDQAGSASRPPLRVRPEIIDCGREYAGTEAQRRTLFRVLGAANADLQAYVEPIEGLPASDASVFRVTEGSLLEPEGVPAGLPTVHSGAVVFAPKGPGAFKAILHVDSSDGRHAKALVQGASDATNAQACDPDGAFGITGHETPLTPDTPKSTVLIENVCAGSVTLSSVLPISGDASEFKLYPPALPLELAPGQQIELGVEFTPTAVQPDSELTIVIGTNSTELRSEFTIRAHRENFLDPASKERSDLQGLAAHHIGAARGAFCDACNQKISDLRHEADDHGFLGIVVDLALGFLIPGIGEALLGAAVAGFLAKLPNSKIGNQIGCALIDYEAKAIKAVVEPLGAKAKSVVKAGPPGDVAAPMASEATDAKETNKHRSPETRVVESLIDQVHIEMTSMQDSVPGLSDTDLIALASLYSPERTVQSRYMAELDKFISAFRSQVKPIGSQSGPVTRFGAGETTRLVWIRDEEGTKHLALCTSKDGPMGIPLGQPSYRFSHWVSPLMKPLALQREPSPPTIDQPVASMSKSDWLLRFEAAKE